MYTKKHLVITAVITAAIVAIVSAVCFFSVSVYDPADTLSRAKQIIMNEYVNPLDDEEKTRLNDWAIQGMVASLGDQYSRYLNTKDLEEYAEEHQESYVGIGVNVIFEASNDTMTVVSPYDGSPAQKAGILPGDILTQVDNIKVTFETYDAVIEYIKSGKNDTMTFYIDRDGEKLTKKVTREEVKRQSVTYKMFGDGMGYVRVSEFIQSTEPDFKAAVEDLKGRQMKGLIIDLRNNPGGYAQTVIAMTDYLLPEGVIAYLEDSHGKRQYYHSDASCLDMPMAVLINQGTASASELLAGSLKAHGLATVIGEKSYGKAVGQSVYPLSGTTALYLTNARYFTPNGECIDKVGITPDIEVSLSEELMGKIGILEPAEDQQLSKAIEILLQKTTN